MEYEIPHTVYFFLICERLIFVISNVYGRFVYVIIN